MNHFLPSFSDGSAALSAGPDPGCVVGPALLPAATPVCCTEWWNRSLMVPAGIAEGLSTTTPGDATSDAFTNLKGRIWVRPLTATAAGVAGQGCFRQSSEGRQKRVCRGWGGLPVGW